MMGMKPIYNRFSICFERFSKGCIAFIKYLMTNVGKTLQMSRIMSQTCYFGIA